MPIPARSSGITSTSSITGISTIPSSACWWTRRSLPIRARSPGSIRGSSPASGARWSPAFPARPASSTRSTARPASFCGPRPTVRQNVVVENRRRHRQGHGESRRRLSPPAGQTRFICPTANGGKDFQAGAYSPADQRDVLRPAEHLRAADRDRQRLYVFL